MSTTVTRHTAAENVPNAQFGLKSPRRNFSMSLSCVMSFADIQQIDLLDHKKKRRTSKDSTSPSEGLGSNRVGSAPGGMGKSYTYLKRGIRRLLGINASNNTYSISGCSQPFAVLWKRQRMP